MGAGAGAGAGAMYTLFRTPARHRRTCHL